MGRRRSTKADAAAGLALTALVVGGLVLAGWYYLFFSLAEESWGLTILTALGLGGVVTLAIRGEAPTGPRWVGFLGGRLRAHPVLLGGAMILAGMGLVNGREEGAARKQRIQQEARRFAAEQAARDKADAESRAAQARFAAMSPQAHVDAARAAMPSGQLDEAERHLAAVPPGTPPGSEAGTLLRECASRRGPVMARPCFSP